ncbi:MAG: tyrosine-type recombinase/integrase [Sphingomonas bacterium]
MARPRTGTGVQVLKTTIRVRFSWRGYQHGLNLRIPPTKENIRAAERKMARVFRDIELGIFDLRQHFPQSPDGLRSKFSSFAASWLGRLPLSKSTRSAYRAAVQEIWIPAFEDRHLAHIRTAEIREIICDRLDEVSARTINNNLIPLRGIFNAAIEEGLIDRSPMVPIRNLQYEHDLPDPFSREEMEAILTHLRDCHPSQAWHWYDFAFATGMRPSEQIAVTWEDVDWDTGAIRVQRARVRGEVKSTKTYRVRDVMLSDRARDILVRQKSYSFDRGQGTPIFLNPVTKRPWPDVQDQRKLYFHPALAALQIRKRNAYNTRHTFATTALMGGVNPAFIAKQLGHADPAVTFKYYARWIVGSAEQVETAKLNRIFSNQT